MKLAKDITATDLQDLGFTAEPGAYPLRVFDKGRVRVSLLGGQGVDLHVYETAGASRRLWSVEFSGAVPASALMAVLATCPVEA